MSPTVGWIFEKDNSDLNANEQNKLSGCGIGRDGVQRGQTSLDEVGYSGYPEIWSTSKQECELR